MRLRSLGFLAAALAIPAAAEPPQFESPHIHPLDLAGNKVLAVNTPDARLSIFSRAGGNLTLVREVRVGIDPISVRAKNVNEAWVVNHLSDDVSIVDLVAGTVIHTLPVGDEPTDVVFVNDPIQDDGSLWAVLCSSQEDRVIVCDAEPPYALIGVVDIPGADPQNLAVNKDRNGVWVAVFESGNHTALADRNLVADPLGPWGGNPPPFDPPLNPDLPPNLMPTNGVIIRKEAGAWLDEQGGDWSPLVTWDVLDADLVFIDISGPVPSIARTVTGAGTLIHDVAVNPRNDDVWAVNIESLSDVLFEPKLRGEAVRNRITRVAAGSTIAEPFGLDTHVSFGPLGQPNPPSALAIKQESLAIPTEATFVARGTQQEIFVTGMGGKRIVVLDPATGAVKRRIPVPEGGTGLLAIPASGGDASEGNFAQPAPMPIPLLDGQLLMADRFLNRLHVVDPQTGATGASLPIGKSAWDPTPEDVRKGRRFLYTGEQSAHGTFACASCHPSGNMDGIAWDLGNPAGELAFQENNEPPQTFAYHPLKGPMVTQSLRGLKDHNPLHWRGDRKDFTRFNPAFSSLLGGDTLATPDMLDYEAFILSIHYPPSPFWTIDNQILPVPGGGDPFAGATIFGNLCIGCHSAPTGTSNQVMFLGAVFGNQNFKIPQLRNLYEKEGFNDLTGPNNKRAFGFLHDGKDQNLAVFAAEPVFHLNPEQQTDLRALLFVFPTETDAATGQEATLNATSLLDALTAGRVDLLQAAAEAGRVDVIAHGVVDGIERGFVWLNASAGGLYQSDRTDHVWTKDDLVDEVLQNGSAITFAGVPRGEGTRMGVDRDLDGYFDGDEVDAGSDPADPSSVPSVLAAGDPSGANLALTRIASVFPSPFTRAARVELYMASAGPARVDVYDVRGRRVRCLLDRDLPAGKETVSWDGLDEQGKAVAAGTYFVKLAAAGKEDSRKVVRVM